ncbi:twin-arginine translocase subunit TatC [Caenibacillus caldisaponilyticus]|uniref:twin-arginine translocase subunit TatC n=1 Tax=Caenibacillus caldisaponilyticus TaxID=1674942 RepID=UPI0009883BD7|nr:twin-arginine translocase subunit TatC [Caenibacillus caldisaponilyticus]
MSEKKMSVSEHLEELRRRLLIIVVGFVATFIIGFFLSKPVILFLQRSETARGIHMNAFRITDPFQVYLQTAFVIGLVLLAPLILYQIWAFISPGLYEHERRVTLAYIPLIIALFLSGVAFSYFVLFPYVLHFMANLSESLGIQNVIGINEYFQFLFRLTLPFGFVFELPVLIMFLTRLGVLTPAFLAKIRKYAYFVLLIIAGIITPPDVVSQLIVMVPLVILYELSLMISRRVYKNKLKQEAENGHDF